MGAAEKTHIIQKQTIEIEFENPDNKAGLQNRIAEIVYDKLLPEIDMLFNEIADGKYILQLDIIEIDSGYLSMNNWEEEFVNNTIHKMKESLLSATKKESSKTDNYHEAATESFLFFLKKGYMPWNSRFESIKRLEEEIQLDSQLLPQLKNLIRHSDKACRRIVLQFSEEFQRNASAVLLDEEKEVFQVIKLVGESLKASKMDKTVIDAGLLKASSFEGAGDVVCQFLEYIYSNAGEEILPSVKVILDNITATNKDPTGKIPEGYIKTLEKMKEKVITESKTSNSNRINSETNQNNPGIVLKEEENENPRPEAGREKIENNKIPETIYINNAGLIILHPFLPEFFANLKLTRENNWNGETARNKAAEILQYLVTGEDDIPEFNLPLNKIMCGIDLDEALKNNGAIDPEVKNECESLLKELIKHWSILKNTGIEALRQTFLQRKGLITPVDNGWLLKVEQKSVDMLINKLPWGLGIIKLPWMKKILFVEWV